MCKSIFIRCLLAFVYFGVLTISSTEVIAQTKLPNPSSVTATGGDGYIDLSWSWNTSDTPTGWTLFFRYQISPELPQSAGGADARSVRISTKFDNNLTNGTAYTVTLQAGAVNADNSQSRSSDWVSVTATPNIDAPTGLLTTAGDGEVTLSWTAVSGVDTITGYDYSQDDGTTWTSIPNSDKTTATYTVTGLTNGQAYTFKVRAVGTGGGGKASDSQIATPMLSPPAAPTNLSAIPGDGQVTLRWTAPPGPITGYQYSQDSGAWTSTGWTPATGTSTTRTVTNLTNGQTYTFKVRAVNSGGNGAESGSASATPDASAPPPPPPPPPPVDINAGTTETLTVQRVNRRTVTLSWDIPTALNAQTIAYEYSTNAGQTWTSTNSTNTSITITGDGFGDLPPTQFKIRAMNQNADGTESFVIISAAATQPRRILLKPRECPLGWTRGSVFGNTKKALIYELKVEADPTNRTSIYQLKSIAIYVHPDENLETLDGWTLKVGTLYNQFGKEFKLTAENSVIDEHDFAHIENPEEVPIPMSTLGYIGQSLPSFDYRLYDGAGVRVDFGISCYKGGGLTFRLWNTADPRLLRVLPLGTSEAALSVQMENLDWRTPFFRSEWTAAVMPDLPAAPAAPSQMKGNIVGTWADLKKK